MTRLTRWFPVASAVLVACATVAWSAAAWAAPTVTIQSIETASGSDWAPPSHFGTGPSTPSQSGDDHYINRADCKAIMAATKPAIRINWQWTPSTIGTYSSVFKLAPRGKSCGESTLQKDDTNTSCVVYSQQNFKIGTFSVDVNLHDLLGKDTNCDDNTEQDAFVYFLVNDVAQVGTAQQVVAFKTKIVVDLAGPAAPTLSSIAPGGGNLTATWKHLDDNKVSGSHVYWATLPIDATAVAAGTVKPQKSAKVTVKTYQIKELVNGTPYYVAVTAIDDHGNESGYSALGKGTPIDVVDAWQHYQASGGAEEGGFAPCNAGPRPGSGGWWLAAMLALTAIGSWRWRNGARAALLAPALVATTLVSAPAHADSPLDNSAEFRATRYLPAIDAPFAGKAKPYADIFGNADWEIGGAADVRLWDRFGSLSVGLGYGWFTKEGKGLERSTGKASTDATTLKILPLSLDLTYRLDPLAHKAGIPFVPYAKIGAMYAIWWMLNGSGDYATYTTASGSKLEALGGTGGWHAAAGLRFLMDVLEPSAARSFDIEMGVNHSYLYVEYDRRVLNDFGSSKSIDLSDGVFSFGLAFDL